MYLFSEIKKCTYVKKWWLSRVRQKHFLKAGYNKPQISGVLRPCYNSEMGNPLTTKIYGLANFHGKNKTFLILRHAPGS